MSVERPAIAHSSDGAVLPPQSHARYSVSTSRTGTPSGACPMIVATPRGHLLFSPAHPHPMMACDLVRSRDGGASWRTIATPRPHHPPAGYRAPRITGLRRSDFEALGRELANGCTLHPWLCRDPNTGRIFASVTLKGAFDDGSGSIVAFSDDDGDSWRSAAVGGGSWDWGKVCVGPPATESSRRALVRSGYPNVVYFSATGPVLIAGPNQLNFKSTDGGETWTRTRDTFSSEQARALECGFPQRGVVAPYGAIYRAWAGTPRHYLPSTSKTEIGVHIVRSLDEGETWMHFELPEARTCVLGATLAVDREHTLYLAWPDSRDGQIRISVSRDRAQTWSNPRKLSLPGVAWTARPTIEVRAPGELAIASWGSAQAEGSGDGWFRPDGRPYSGYVTLCRDVHGDQAVFWTAAVNDPARPLLPDGESALSSGEYLGPPSFAADGTVWAGFVDRSDTPSGIAARLAPFSEA